MDKDEMRLGDIWPQKGETEGGKRVDGRVGGRVKDPSN
jgi:hypothetical protein